jgi:hypothetical protein
VEQSPVKGPSAESWRESFAQSVKRQRLAASERVAQERQRLREHEANLSARLDEATAQLAAAQQETLSATAKVEARETELAERKQRLEAREKQFEERQAELTRQFDERQAEHERQRETLQAKLQEQMELNRRQAEASRDEAKRHAEELERIRSEAREEAKHQQADSTGNSQAQIQSMGEQIGQLLAKFSQQETTWSETNRRLSQQLEEARVARSAVGSAELQALRDENKQLETWLAESEQRASAVPAAGGSNQEIDDLRRRFEMAVQDVRELKTKNSELTDQLAKAKQALPAQTAGAGGSDWESLKKKMLAQMETDFDESDPQQKADRLTVQGAIKITDDMIAEKDRELEDLRRLLDSQTQQVGEMAVGAAAVAQLLDTDELVRQERESLKRLQDSLREQSRQAEVDISLERAKLARERTELEEKLRILQSEKMNFMPGDEAGDKKGQPSRRKWLARLGLGDGKDE